MLLPNGGGGYVLDGFGGLHPFALSSNPMPPDITNNAYWVGWDIAHDVVLSPGSTAASVSGLTLDGHGGLHPLGNGASPQGATYWSSLGMARAALLSPNSTASTPAGWVLDASDGLHPFGGAPSIFAS